MTQPYERSEKIIIGRYRFDVEIRVIPYAGDPYGSMDEMPGTFLKADVRLGEVSAPSALEALAAERHLLLHSESKEITREPDGYPELWSAHFVDSLRRNPGYFIQGLQDKLKRDL